MKGLEKEEALAEMQVCRETKHIVKIKLVLD